MEVKLTGEEDLWGRVTRVVYAVSWEGFVLNWENPSPHLGLFSCNLDPNLMREGAGFGLGGPVAVGGLWPGSVLG